MSVENAILSLILSVVKMQQKKLRKSVSPGFTSTTQLLAFTYIRLTADCQSKYV